jgi:uncharacterized protein YlzI (FlbEa/FlbD family)
MSQFVRINDAVGNTIFLNPHHVVSVTQNGPTTEVSLSSGKIVTIESTAEKIIDQLSIVLS